MCDWEVVLLFPDTLEGYTCRPQLCLTFCHHVNNVVVLQLRPHDAKPLQYLHVSYMPSLMVAPVHNPGQGCN